ncbi:GNAT family N-acetyltransferase [Streptomyces sp. NPDC054940]
MPARRPAGRTWTVIHCGGGPPFLLHLSRVSRHPVRACYPFGAHDLVVALVLPGSAPSGEDVASRLLRQLAPALFAADARCRRIVAAPDEHDAVGRRVLAAGGFREITEAELPDGGVVLFATERPEIADLSTALDDMPH